MFAGAEIALGYASARPPVHPLVIDKIATHLGLSSPIELAVDIGCGAGLSTSALVRIARRCIGFDPAVAMVRQAAVVAPQARVFVGRAEALPLKSRSVDLLTAAGSLNYADLDACFAEACRVLAPGGTLAAYDFAFGRRCSDPGRLEAWHGQLLERWPRPTLGRRDLDPAVLGRGPMRVVAQEVFSVGLVLDLESYVNYVLTESSIAAAVRGGTPARDIRAWCTETVAALFVAPRRVEFDGYLVCLRPT